LTTGYERCEETIIPNNAKEVKSAFGDGQFIPMYEVYGIVTNDKGVLEYTLIGYAASDKFCVDCREYGGTTLKPDFWE
jgi:hypothetical protein